MSGARRATYAKVNLFLAVRGRRADGYHEIDSVFHEIDLADEVDVDVSATPEVEVNMTGNAGVPMEANLAYRAARELRRETPHRVGGARISITKRIPLGAGLGGGSSNAAAVLGALNELWSVGLSADELATVGARVGSDVPFFIAGGTARVGGRGEVVRAISAPAPLWLVVGLFERGLATGAVYEAWDRVGVAGTAAASSMVEALDAGSPEGVAAALHNDLEGAALTLRPGLARAKDSLAEAGALGVCMTGSGPTLFGVCTDRDHAVTVAARAERAFDRVELLASAPPRFEHLG